MTDAAPTVSLPLGAAGSAAPGESRWRIVARNAFPFLVVGAIWEIVAKLGIFPRKLFPPLEEIAATFIRLTADGILPHHVFDTLLRLTAGFALAALAGVVIGIAMGRWRFAEDIFLPLVSIGAPIPGIAYAPLFLLWFGLGNRSDGAAGRLRLGVSDHLQHLDRREVGEGNLGALGAGDGRQRPAAVRHVILPGALPYILTGLRLGLAQAWRILVGVEMLAAVPWGLGWMIFGAREFLNTDVMLAGVFVIGLIGLALEKLVFQRIERYTVVRWGMMS